MGGVLPKKRLMSNPGTTLKKILLGCLVLLLILSGALVGWFKFGGYTHAKETVLLKLAYPISLVGRKQITAKQFRNRVALANAYFNDTENLNEQILRQLVLETKINILADTYGIETDSKFIDDEFKHLKQEQPLYIEKFELTDEQLKENILRQENLKSRLRIWFNSQEDLNTKEYSVVNSLLARIQKGESIAALAPIYSKDGAGKLLEGDLGFLEINNLLPELRQALDLRDIGTIELIPSRHGLHIIKIEDKKDQQLHLRQIFIPVDNFQNWFQNEVNKIKTINLVKI